MIILLPLERPIFSQDFSRQPMEMVNNKNSDRPLDIYQAGNSLTVDAFSLREKKVVLLYGNFALMCPAECQFLHSCLWGNPRIGVP